MFALDCHVGCLRVFTFFFVASVATLNAFSMGTCDSRDIPMTSAIPGDRDNGWYQSALTLRKVHIAQWQMPKLFICSSQDSRHLAHGSSISYLLCYFFCFVMLFVFFYNEPVWNILFSYFTHGRGGSEKMPTLFRTVGVRWRCFNVSDLDLTMENEMDMGSKTQVFFWDFLQDSMWLDMRSSLVDFPLKHEGKKPPTMIDIDWSIHTRNAEFAKFLLFKIPWFVTVTNCDPQGPEFCFGILWQGSTRVTWSILWTFMNICCFHVLVSFKNHCKRYWNLQLL